MLALAARPPEVRLGQTPREDVYRRGKSRVYRYGGRRAGPSRPHPPVLLVPNLAMTRPDIFDLHPGSSLIEFMLEQGFDFYLLDWGEFGEEDRDLSLADCVEVTLPRVITRVLDVAGASELSLLGYCMGATLGACHLALQPDSPVRGLVSLAGPFDFASAGLFTRWLDRRFFDADRLADALPVIPPDFFRLAYGLLRPTSGWSAALGLWWNAEDDAYVRRHQALRQWADTYTAMPSEFFRQWVKELYQENRLVTGRLRLRAGPVDLGHIRCPLLVVLGTEDNIVPPGAARALMGQVSSERREVLELPGGHASLIVGARASTQLWPALAKWLAKEDRTR